MSADDAALRAASAALIACSKLSSRSASFAMLLGRHAISVLTSLHGRQRRYKDDIYQLVGQTRPSWRLETHVIDQSGRYSTYLKAYYTEPSCCPVSYLRHVDAQPMQCHSHSHIHPVCVFNFSLSLKGCHRNTCVLPAGACRCAAVTMPTTMTMTD